METVIYIIQNVHFSIQQYRYHSTWVWSENSKVTTVYEDLDTIFKDHSIYIICHIHKNSI